METGGGGPTSSSGGRSDDAAELAALDAEIARLSLRRDQLRARLAATDTGQVAAGWYPDPTGQHVSRYWNGREWTDTVGARLDGSGAGGQSATTEQPATPTAEPASTMAQPAASIDQPTSSAGLPKANWYPDPSGRFSWRYWNGREWTDSVARNGVTYSDPPTGSATATPRPSTPAQQSASPQQPVLKTPTQSVPPVPTPTPRPTPTPAQPAPVSAQQIQRPTSAPRPERESIDIDVGKLILFVGAALLIGGIGGLTAYLWSRLPAIGRLGLLGLAAAAQIVIATRIRERLRTAAEAFAATGIATLLFAVLSVSAAASWDGAVGFTLGVVGILLLVFARFRTWVIAGHLAIVIGAVGVVVAEPWSQTALIIAVVLGGVRWLVSGDRISFRSEDIQLFPEVVTASGLVALLAAPVLGIAQFETTTSAAVVVLVGLVVSEIIVRTRQSHVDHILSVIAGAVVAVGGVGWSGYLWLGEVRSDGLAAMAMTAVIAFLLWRASRTESAVATQLTAAAAVLVPVAARFACSPASERELIVYCVVAAIAGVAAKRVIAKPMSVWFWVGAVASSIVATEQLPYWPRLGLVTVALASLAVLLQLDELRYVAAAAATLTVADVLYGRSFDLTWWFRPDVVGATAALFLYVAVRTRSKPLSPTLGTWAVPKYWESAAALLAVPVAKLMSTPAMLDLPSEATWRLGLVGALTVAVWGYGAVRRSRPNAFQIATALSAALLLVSRVGDESLAVQTGASVIIGCIVTAGLAAIAHIRKIDELRYVAAATATATVAILLYGQLIEVTWWFRPDIVGASAALFLFVAVRTMSTSREVSIGTWKIPRYWEPMVVLLAVPVADLVSQPALASLPNESKWRLGFVLAVTAPAWAHGAMKRTISTAPQVVSTLAMVVLVVSRVADDSLAVQTGAWILVGCIATVVLAAIARIRKIDDLWHAAAATATATVTVLLYGQLIEVTWWFRPDIVGASAALFLFVAVRTMSTPREVSIGTWKIPRYWESMVALLAVPTTVSSEPALAHLSTESKWRLGFVLAVTAAAWAHGAMKRTTSTAAQAVSVAAMGVLIVSRVADESQMVRAGALVLVGCGFIAAALLVKHVELLLPAAACWALAVVTYSPPGPLEVITCSFAAIAALVAFLARRFGRTGSFDFIPATALALVPSAFAAAGAVLDGSVDSEQVTRITIVLVIGALALTVGTYRRLAALVGPPLVALVVLAVAQLIVVQRQTSGWVSALVAGVVLLVVGTRLEYLRSVSRRASDLVRSLH